MATSVVSICNKALQRLGAARITSLTEDSSNARNCNLCYEDIRDEELRAHVWNFAKKRATLAADATAPDFDYLYAFPLPSDCLRPLPPKRVALDWVIENHQGRPAILTNDGNSIELTYIARITDPTVFDPLFVKALAMSMAEHMCEDITQSNSKKADAKADRKEALAIARRTNAMENISQEPVEDPWLTARY
jgi:hypothetical protein